VAVGPNRRSILSAHGIRPGALVHVDGDAPFRGPRIVRLGRTRLAIARLLAAEISVVPDADPPITLAPAGGTP
jgi:Fe2+ transport system protein FeoA